MAQTTNHPSFRSDHNAPPVHELRQLAEELGADVKIRCNDEGGYHLEFGSGYTVDCATFEDACDEIRLY